MERQTLQNLPPNVGTARTASFSRDPKRPQNEYYPLTAGQATVQYFPLQERNAVLEENGA